MYVCRVAVSDCETVSNMPGFEVSVSRQLCGRVFKPKLAQGLSLWNEGEFWMRVGFGLECAEFTSFGQAESKRASFLAIEWSRRTVENVSLGTLASGAGGLNSFEDRIVCWA